MNGPGLGGSAPPRASERDLERLLKLLDRVAGDKSTREYLAELLEAKKSADVARKEAEAVDAAATKRIAKADAIEAEASRVRAELAAEVARGLAAVVIARAPFRTSAKRHIGRRKD